MAHPPRFDDADPLLARVREVALALPGAAEKVSHGRPTFFTKKVFAIFGGVVKGNHGSDALRQALVFLPDDGERPALLEDSRFVVPGYEGAYGWLALDLRVDVDWDEVAELVESSYRATAPARLVAELDGAVRSGPGTSKPG
ncbi:MmcQ/YjbR family DNA-binding protein [Phycicoccus sp. CSK15P-2]|uniref:MmcQ/YjbR family DNA-binding protein n=1 Tax=Phycicoccus sp. CSK15P-2 TaxID=2807627 RepID=UPI00194FA833|nr:MmcQ/YjbR family DNA-binding protein [Phycicoccus sp. CSK15P-2]MBM6405699.1 MmcQ/YjbR family DNA-binding protein [Phycicoccus sp. CSK15P-2]